MTNLITFHAISNLVVHGTGTIDGQGEIWWDCYNKARCTRPYLLEFVGCSNLVLRHISLKDSPNKHLAFSSCTNLTIHAVTITAPGNSPNTDGIVMQDCQNVQITGCMIGTGDDCIAILTNTYNVDISRISCGPGHGISIGSLGKDNTVAAVERIHIHDSTIYNALTGARIKTWQGGSGYAKNITYERISMANVTTPIVIDQTYYTLEVSTDVAISDIVFKDIHGTTTEKVAIKLDCSSIVPCKELVFDDVTLTRIGDDQTAYATSQNAYGITNGTIIPSIHFD
ncbi:hypothetical protein LUZ63_016691 [Rhynchospora breviuscula]|uniref:Polygalacturonase n=1 Tax=Rhynchospora breviuscula TaxID=2022672 RepID=A0A9P9ZBX7_9POAL|nr:hypothetical protein LUZ63_016691 [Rhynchospora breviuscula]